MGDWWYLLVAEGGTERGHAVTIARSRSPQGPFESNPDNPILTHRGTDLPVQNTGHADLVQRPDGSWAICYHGVRSRGSSPEWHVLGRETFIDDVTWEDGWPVLTGHLEPMAPAGHLCTDDLGADALPSSWVGADRFPAEFVTREAAGWRIEAKGSDPVFVGRRQEHLFARIEARLTVEGVGGVSMRIDPRHFLELECSDGRVSAIWAIGDVRHVLGEHPWTADCLLVFRTEPFVGHEFSTARGPDVVIAGIVDGSDFIELGRIDGRYLSTEIAGGMTGRMIGVSVSSGTVILTSFRYLGADDHAVFSTA